MVAWHPNSWMRNLQCGRPHYNIWRVVIPRCIVMLPSSRFWVGQKTCSSCLVCKTPKLQVSLNWVNQNQTLNQASYLVRIRSRTRPWNHPPTGNRMKLWTAVAHPFSLLWRFLKTVTSFFWDFYQKKKNSVDKKTLGWEPIHKKYQGK